MDEAYLTYRSSDGSLYVDFLFRREDDGYWYIYICSEIDFEEQNDDPDETHQVEEEPYNYICWSEDIYTLKKAKAVAALWADTVALYIQDCGDFDTIARVLTAQRKNRR